MGPRQNIPNVRVDEIKKGYLQTLQDLTFNSKPHIDVLTEVAEENREYASAIVECIKEQLEKVSGPLKLPILYLIDSIIKNNRIGHIYIPLFCKNIHKIFKQVYEQSDDTTKSKLMKLRYFWNGILPAKILKRLDTIVRTVNPGWQTPSEHTNINPKFISTVPSSTMTVSVTTMKMRTKSSLAGMTKEELPQKQKESQELELKKQELETLKISWPVTDNDKDAEKLVVIANELFAQVKQVKSGSYNPLQIQKVRNSAKVIKESLIKILDDIPDDPKFVSLAKNPNSVKDVIKKITEIEKVLADVEKFSQIGRKVITDESQLLPIQAATLTASVPCTRDITNSRRWTKAPLDNSYVCTKPNGSLTAPEKLQNSPAFRIAPVSSQLIDAAVRRVRDPRLRKMEEDPLESSSRTAVNSKEKKVSTALPEVESKSGKRNESPTTSNSVQLTNLEKESVLRVKVKQDTASNQSQPEPETAPPTSPENKNEGSSPEKGKPKNEPNVFELGFPKKQKLKAVESNSKSAATINELLQEPQTKKGDNEKKTKTKTFTKEERTKRLKILLRSKELIAKLSQNNPAMAEKLSRLMKKGEACKRKSTVTSDQLMDITDDTVDCIIVSSPQRVENSMTEESISTPTPETSTVSVPEPVAQSDDCDDVIIDETVNAEYDPALHLSNNVGVRIPSPHQDVDIRPLISPVVSSAASFPLSIVSDVILPSASASTATERSTFKNPFGINETKDIDYRQLFFPLNPTQAILVEDENEGSQSNVIDLKSPEQWPEDMDKPPKRKHGSEPKPTKRKRTSSSSRCGSNYSSKSSIRCKNHYSSKRNDSDDDSDLELSENSEEEKRLPVDSKVLQLYVVKTNDDVGDLEVMQTWPAAKSPPSTFPGFGTNLTADVLSSKFIGILSNTMSEVPPANEDVLKMIDRDPMKTVHIDGIPREIRHYGSTAVIFLNWDDPRQIAFKSVGGPRQIIIDEKYCITCSLNTPDIEAKVYGKKHRFRLGVPTRELFINGIGYECYFGGPAIQARFDGQNHAVKVAGKLPLVDFGAKRLDLVAGKIDLIINDVYIFPVFLDSKPQKIVVNEDAFVIMFIDSLNRVLINDVPFRAEFGGLSQSFRFNTQVYYFRFTMLPLGIVPGAVNIYQMIMTRLPSPPSLPLSLHEYPMMPVPTTRIMPTIPNIAVSTMSVLPHTESKPAAADTSKTGSQSNETTASSTVNSLLGSLDIDELLKSLMASGVVSNKKKDDNKVKHVDFRKAESLKQKQPGMISILYSGNQCGSCGLRFPEEQHEEYSEHLDWHFRLKRRGKDGSRTIHSRKWFYKWTDWKIFQEMENKSDKAQSWFDSHPTTEYTEGVLEDVSCVSAPKDREAICSLCLQKFDQVFNQDIEEWQLRDAICVEEVVYHPSCYQDHKDTTDHSEDVVEIVEQIEPPIDVDDTAVPENAICDSEEVVNNTDENIVPSPVIETTLAVAIKQEKSDGFTVTKRTESANSLNSHSSEDQGGAKEDGDSDVEEVQLIEESIEEVIIPDDSNEMEDDNLETLNAEEFIAARQECDDNPITETAVLEISDRIVDITQPTSIVSIDGNIELGESYHQIMSGPTKIKINIAKSHNVEEKSVASPKPLQEAERSDETERVDETKVVEEPPPPGEELIILVAADVKPRLENNKLTQYPPVTKGHDLSGLCSIM